MPIPSPTIYQAPNQSGRASSSALPPPPAGMHWEMTFDDEFTQDKSIRTNLWNGGAGNIPWCNDDCSSRDGTNGEYPGLKCGEWLFGTPEGNDPCGQHYDGVSVNAADGLVLQPYQDYNHRPSSAKEGYNNHTEGASAAVNSYGKFSQMYGYFEWRAKYPHDKAGEGDGLHPDIWARTVNQPDLEIDVAETIIGTQNTNQIAYSGVHDCCGENSSALTVNPDISSDWHTYGLYWQNDGSGPNGSVTMYVDGMPQTSPYTLSSHNTWSNGIYFFLSMDSGRSFGAWGGGNPAGPQTSNSNPFMIQYMRAWKLVPN